jgi:hypothetical protein
MSFGTRRLIARSTKIICVGRNFVDHAKELGNAVPTEPFFFLKPPSSLLLSGAIEKPPQVTDLHFEVELGVLIGTGGRDIPKSKAMSHIAGYVLALDMTARCVQEAAKAKRLLPEMAMLFPLERMPGVVDHGLFLFEADVVLVEPAAGQSGDIEVMGADVDDSR